MGDLFPTRIEPAAPSVDIEKRSPSNGSPGKRRPAPEKSEKDSASPSVDSGDPVEEIHQIDELA